MPKTRAQKSQVISEGGEELKNSTNLIFADFGGTTAEEIRNLRFTLKGVNAKMGVIKKRLLKIILKEKGIDFDPKQFEAQVGAVFVKGEISETVQLIYKFAKDKEKFKILGGIDLIKGENIGADFLRRIGQLPSREILLGQVLGTMIAPLRAFMWILSKKGLSVGRQVEEMR